jgi:predicted transcriptional regulator
MPIVYPHEFIARKAIHSVKAELAKELKTRGISQKDIAKLMESQVSAISQYVNGQRGGSYKLSETVMTLLTAVAEAIHEEPTEELLKYGVSQICNKIIEEEYGYNFDEEEENGIEEIEESQYGDDIDLSD